MFRPKTLDVLSKHCPNKINKLPCKIFYTSKMTTLHKVKIVDTSNLQPGELMRMYFAFYNVTSIRGFTSILTVICEKTIMLWSFPTESKLSPVCTIHSIITTLNNEQCPCKCIRFYECVALEKSTYVTNLLV